MASWLKQSTSVDVGIGPFLDETDGKTAETALTITQPDVRLKKNAGAWAQKNAAQTLTHEENGWYEVTLDATDTATLGLLIVAVHESGALPVWKEYMVVAANIYDSIVGGGDVLDVSVTQWLGTAASTPTVAGVPNVNVKTWNDLTTVALPLVPTTAGRTLDVSVGGEAGIDFANIGSPTTVVGLTGTTVGTVTAVTGLTAATVHADLDDIQARLPAALTANGNIKADTLRIGGTLQTAGDVPADTAAIKLKTDNLPSDPADESLIIAATDAIASLVTTVDTVVDAIKLKTDKLTFDADNALDANTQKINDVTILGDGNVTPFHV